ncbi:CsbD family protein [Streptodolium elevatio]|uniref:CsbD family protein n=1 Tax=Streptodolium elevatio TaxID=3157996 RepID=A0ABV3DE59_9ACTN
MGFKSAKNELKGRAKEVAGRLTGNRPRRNAGKAEKEQAKAQGLTEATHATDRPSGPDDTPTDATRAPRRRPPR